MYKIGLFSKIVNTSVKTLRYYDSIDLLKPDNVDIFTGYRYYSDKQIKEYDEIIKLKKLDFSLEEIKNYLDNPSQEFLLKKKEQLKNKIILLEESIEEIDKMIDKKELNIKIVKANTSDLIKKWDEDIKNSYLYKNMESNNCNYYHIYNNGEFLEDFWIYLVDDGYNIINNLCINRMNSSKASIFDNEEVMNILFDYLSQYYENLTVVFADETFLEERIKKAVKYGFNFIKSLEAIDCKDELFKINIYEMKLKSS